MLRNWLPFEQPLVEVEERIADLRETVENEDPRSLDRIAKLEEKREQLKQQVFANLTAWDKVQLARHPRRPHTLDYVHIMCDDFVELHGDRSFGDDAAIVAGLGSIDGKPLAIVGHQKGRTTKERQRRNFGSAHPGGYRKALRVMKMAEKFGLPVLSIVDTPAAACLEEAEAGGISQAIAWNMKESFLLRVPIAVVIIGEGGSGGAIGIAVGDRILMLEYAMYSVIPPESCASIIWRDSSRAEEAAKALKLTSDDARELGVVDKVIPEPLGAAHRECFEMARRIQKEVTTAFEELQVIPIDELLRQRHLKFMKIGKFIEAGEAPAAQTEQQEPPEGEEEAPQQEQAPEDDSQPRGEDS